MRTKFLLPIVMVVLTLVLAGCTGGSEDIKKGEDDAIIDSTADSQSAASEPLVFAIGETATTEIKAVTVHGIEKVNNIGQYQTADEGFDYLIIDITIENLDDEPIHLSTLLAMSIEDSDGYKYTSTFASTDKSFSGGELGVGKKRRGEVVFEVSESAPGLQFIYDFGAFTKGQAIWNLE